MQKSPDKSSRPQEPSRGSASAVTPALQRDHAPLENELLKRLYSNMLRCRLFHEMAQAQARRAKSKLHPASGREAVEVGCTIELQPEDIALCPENSIAAPLVLGATAESIIRRFAKATPPEPEDSTSVRFVSLPASADALAVAAGIGYAYRHLGNQNVVFALDAGTVPARAIDAFTLIARDKLPVIAVIENLGKGSHPARLLQTARKHNIPCITVDANDAVAVYRVAREAIHRARTARGATVIDCYPLPLPGNRPTDGLTAMEQYMKRFGIWADEWKRQLQAQFDAEFDRES